MRHVVPLFLALTVLSACGESPTEVPLEPEGAELARAAGHPVVLVRANAPENATQAGAPLVDNLADAVALVQAGGTIKVFGGTYVTESVVIDKPLTIDGAGGEAVIRNESTARAISVEDGAGLVMTGLTFENAYPAFGYSIQASGSNATFAVVDSRFRGGATAIWASNGSLQVRESVFEGNEYYTLVYTGDGRIENNTMADCGRSSCIAAHAGATGTITGNTLSNALTGPGPEPEGGFPSSYPFNHSVLLIFTGADITVAGNEVDGCGWGSCVVAGRGAVARVHDNVITGYQAQGTRIAIVAGDGQGGRAAPGNGSTVVARNNEIIGVGDPITDRSDVNQYGYRFAALISEGIGSSLVSEGNTIQGADRGFLVKDGASLTGTDNVLSLLRIGADIWGSSPVMDVHQSDLTDYVTAIHMSDNTSSSLTCNYWGSASGPSGVSTSNGSGSELYTPWSTSPIAGTGRTTCSGGGAL